MHIPSFHKQISFALVGILLAGMALTVLPPTAVQAATSLLFATAVNYSAGYGAKAIIADDLNLDGKLDLVVANGTDNTLSVVLGSGNGVFAANVDYATGSLPNSVAAGDFNLDGKPDLAVTTPLCWAARPWMARERRASPPARLGQARIANSTLNTMERGCTDPPMPC